MSFADLVAIAAPAAVITVVASWLVVRGRADRDAVLDLRDVHTVVLATRAAPPARSGPPTPAVRGALVDPAGGGSLGARLRSVAEPEAATRPTVDAPATGRVVLVRRRRRPLVAVSREPSPR